MIIGFNEFQSKGSFKKWESQIFETAFDIGNPWISLPCTHQDLMAKELVDSIR
jgi:hypothetical protein